MGKIVDIEPRLRDLGAPEHVVRRHTSSDCAHCAVLNTVAASTSTSSARACHACEGSGASAPSNPLCWRSDTSTRAGPWDVCCARCRVAPVRGVGKRFNGLLNLLFSTSKTGGGRRVGNLRPLLRRQAASARLATLAATLGSFRGFYPGLLRPLPSRPA
jgi:hypothetical protein